MPLYFLSLSGSTTIMYRWNRYQEQTCIGHQGSSCRHDPEAHAPKAAPVQRHVGASPRSDKRARRYAWKIITFGGCSYGCLTSLTHVVRPVDGSHARAARARNTTSSRGGSRRAREGLSCGTRAATFRASFTSRARVDGQGKHFTPRILFK